MAESWHAQSIDSICRLLHCEQTGLRDDADIKNRQAQYGLNTLPPLKKRHPVLRFLLQFNNTLIYVLLGSAVITSLLGHWVDTVVIAGVAVINAIIGFMQEGKAEKAIDAIRNMLPDMALVLREGRRFLISAKELVPGDVIFLQSGDKVPADIRLISTKNLRIDESALTGESEPSEKNTLAVNQETLMSDRACMAHSSTLVTYGQGSGIVVETGTRTEIGRINVLLQSVKGITTPLIRRLRYFGYILSIAIVSISVMTFAYGLWFQGYALADMFLAAVSLAVAAIPEGLPATITITLAIGVQGMAKRNAIIRQLPAVETLGSVTVICSDKTGTLTCNEMTVQTLVFRNRMIEVTGVGYHPEGDFVENGRALALTNIASDPDIVKLTQIGVLCNDAVLQQKESVWHLAGDPTEGALLTLGLKAGLDLDELKQTMIRNDFIPFESQHQFMATRHHDHQGHHYTFIKGAPEKILKMCESEYVNGKEQLIDKNYWAEKIDFLAHQGKRVLALAVKQNNNSDSELVFSHIEKGCILVGLVGMIDPPRVEAIAAVKACQEAGITVKMITGDHAITAHAIAAQIGLTHESDMILTGKDIESMDDKTLRETVTKVNVFARTTPEHKLRLVMALQANGEVVAMTGDGVNDAPALKRAEIGIAMGKKGTEVAKEAAAMVLADDNFASIEQAVRAGRTVYNNIEKSIMFLFPTNGSQGLIVFLAIMFGYVLPMTPIHVLWVNMITAITLSLSLAFEPTEKFVMKQPPRNPTAPLLSPFLIWRIIFVSFILVLGTFWLFSYQLAQTGDLDYARTVAVNVLVLSEAFYLFSCRYMVNNSASWKGLVGNPYVLITIACAVIAQLLFTYLPLMQTLFGTKNIPLEAWGLIMLVSSSVFVLIELEKSIFRYTKAAY